MYHIHIGKKNYKIEVGSKGFIIGGKKVEASIKKLEGRVYQVIKDRKSFFIEIMEEKGKKFFRLKIGHNEYDATLQDQHDLLLERFGMNGLGRNSLQELRAPMPGLVLEVFVNKDDKVQVDDKLLVLEAMKMENVIKSSGSGKVKKILAKKGDIVEKNQVMIQFD